MEIMIVQPPGLTTPFIPFSYVSSPAPVAEERADTGDAESFCNPKSIAIVRALDANDMIYQFGSFRFYLIPQNISARYGPSVAINSATTR